MTAQIFKKNIDIHFHDHFTAAIYYKRPRPLISFFNLIAPMKKEWGMSQSECVRRRRCKTFMSVTFLLCSQGAKVMPHFIGAITKVQSSPMSDSEPVVTPLLLSSSPFLQTITLVSEQTSITHCVIPGRKKTSHFQGGIFLN